MKICKSDVYFVIVMLFIFYILYKLRNKEKEPFAVEDNVKAAINQVYNADVDAIRNLSSIATKLQDGGLTSAGNLTVAGNLRIVNKISTNNLDPNDMPNGWGGGIRTYDVYSSGTIAAGPDGKELKSYMNSNGDIYSKSSIITDGKMWCKGGTAGNGGGTHFPYDNGDNFIRGHTNQDGDFRANGSLTVAGNFILNNPLYRKHMVAGYYHIKAYGRSIPLYYGWNILWQNGDGFHLSARLMLYEKRSGRNGTVNFIQDMREANDQNWRPRRLVVFPGYTVRFYYWDQPSEAADKFPNPGDYDWTEQPHKPNIRQCVHFINISLSEQGVFPWDDVTGRVLCDYNWAQDRFPSKSANGRWINDAWDLG